MKMGYRNYLYVVDKDKFDKVRNLSRKELIDSGGYVSIHDIFKETEAEEAFEVGKYFEHTDDIQKYLSPMFLDEEYEEYINEEMEYKIASPELLDYLITLYKNKIVDNYKDLLNEKPSDALDERTQTERLTGSIESHLSWLRYLTDIPENKYQITGSWLYEHEIFNLLLLKKIFNPEKQYLFWCGW
jgi:hypothetical protein